jgi:hypothetical protein
MCRKPGFNATLAISISIPKKECLIKILFPIDYLGSHATHKHMFLSLFEF